MKKRGDKDRRKTNDTYDDDDDDGDDDVDHEDVETQCDSDGIYRRLSTIRTSPLYCTGKYTNNTLK